MPTKIETSMTEEELAEFFRRAAQLKRRTGPALQVLAGEFGVTISHNSANTFRKGAFADYLEELKAKRELAENVAAVAKNGLSTSDAAASILSQKLFDRLLNAPSLSDDESDQLSLSLSRLRAGDQRARYLEAKVAEMEAAAAARRAAAEKAKAALAGLTSKGGLTKESLARIEEAASLL
jgi:hypothetical protein